MAEDTQQQDKTEQATPKRLDDARRKGQIPRSRELSMAAVLITGALALYSDSAQISASFREMMARSLRMDRASLFDPAFMTEALSQAIFAGLSACIPLLTALAAAAVFGSMIIGGWIFTPAPVAFKFERLDPVAGLGRMFSVNGLVEVLKALGKAGLIIFTAVVLLISSMDSLLGLSDQPLNLAMGSSVSLTILTLGLCSGALLLIAAVDAPYQLWSHAQKMKMTRKEVEDELKESEGRPEVRNRIRQLQQEVARRRMLEEVPRADVVITNPTHFAVALRYDENRMRAPIVLAKGADETAARIRAIATENKVALFESPLLARALYWTTDLRQEIPAQLYLAVAQVLTYIYRLKLVRDQGGAWPERPDVAVDEKLASGPQRRRRRR
ncbi:MAG: flagellar biosynthesis protein FlhB [Gammaproteobacteria bacterium]|nr:flagellar biosynthesis protein FlhB [Gammaproteobacteria bacterium]